MPELTTMEPPPSAATDKRAVFITRLRSTLILWGLIGSALVLRWEWLMLAMVAFFGLVTTIEYLRMDQDDLGGSSYRRLASVFSFVYWLGISWHCLTHHGEHPWWMDAALLVAVLQGAFVITLKRGLEGDTTLLRVFNTVFATAYTSLMFAFMARLLFFNGSSNGPFLMLLVIMVTKFTDMGAYFIGSLFGRHKMIPHISPAKSWEGFIGAVLGSYGAMAVMLHFFGGQLNPLTWGHAMILAPLLCVVAVVGDLAESVLKRCHQIKDSGHKLPGIGGILDLTDSLLFTGPVAYLYLRAIA